MTASEPIHTVAAGAFGQWLEAVRASLRDDGGTDVPCGDCVGCCISSYFIPVRSTDRRAQEAIPPSFLVTAPGQSGGDAMMGYREDGACPMLSAGKCTIYSSRPQTCRDYDCRIFAAAGIDAGGEDKRVINKRVREWRFSYASDDDLAAHRAVKSAAAFIQGKRESFPNSRAPTAPTGIAVLAVKTYAVFLDDRIDEKSDQEIAYKIIQASGQFDSNTAE
jgi:Fe-S-cluster containining protein